MSATAALPGLRQAPRPKYLALALMSAQESLAYPRTVLLNLLVSAAWLAISHALWGAVFLSAPRVGDFDWERMRTYMLLAQWVQVLLTSADPVFRMVLLVRRGNIASELHRPYDVMKAQLALSVGAGAVGGLAATLVSVGFGAGVLHVSPPASPAAALLFLSSVVLGFLIKFLLGFIVALLCFWTLNWVGVNMLYAALSSIFSGLLVPLELYPAGLRAIALALPFHSTLATPLAIYLGELRGLEALQALGTQGLWAAVLWGGARALWRPSLRVLQIQGG